VTRYSTVGYSQKSSLSARPLDAGSERSSPAQFDCNFTSCNFEDGGRARAYEDIRKTTSPSMRTCCTRVKVRRLARLVRSGCALLQSGSAKICFGYALIRS
jgi:hypothetical protein